MGNPFIVNLENYVTLSDADRAAIEALMGRRVSFTAGMELLAQESSPRACHVLLEGQAYRHRNLADGRRQILCFAGPGDVLDLQGLFLDLDYEVSGLGKGQIAVVAREDMETLIDTHPQVALGLWRLTLVEAAIFREWMVGMGRRSAQARIAHLLCEVYTRMRATGVAQNGRCPFPVTQTHLGDSLGLSVVHTNRVIQTLRAEGVADVARGELVVLDWPGLRAVGEFDPAYLHLPKQAI